MKFNQKASTAPSGLEHIRGNLPLEIAVPLAASKQIGFKVIAEESGGKLPRLAANLVDAASNTLYESADSRLFGSDQPHFVTVGKPKHTASNTDKEIDAQTVKYRIVSLDPSDTDHAIVIGVQHA